MIIVPDRFPSLCFGLSYFHFCSALNALSSGILVFGSIVMLSPSILFRMPLCGATVFQWGIPFPLFSGQMSQMLLVCFCHLEIPPDFRSFSKEICSIQVACNVERKKSFPTVSPNRGSNIWRELRLRFILCPKFRLWTNTIIPDSAALLKTLSFEINFCVQKSVRILNQNSNVSHIERITKDSNSVLGASGPILHCQAGNLIS